MRPVDKKTVPSENNLFAFVRHSRYANFSKVLLVDVLLVVGSVQISSRWILSASKMSTFLQNDIVATQNRVVINSRYSNVKKELRTVSSKSVHVVKQPQTKRTLTFITSSFLSF